ncbi:MAG: bis(5'-nucleosyl)-tetraphosphatase, symmetrical [Planctomycetota bacterium]|nr:MAG: bis(5'-nucleosyl)-tetraphosphatase, symmetrical [Planctomycetota bacterium]
MAVFVVGDLQGCATSFESLLSEIRFSADSDQLWLVGDLVNRGPDSLRVLRWVYAHRACVRSVLGNHDLHLLAAAAGRREASPRDTLDAVLSAPDAPELLAWLARQPLLYEDAGHALLHAGLLPSWSWELARQLARELERSLQHDGGSAVWEALATRAPLTWSDDLRGLPRLAAALQAFTRLRTCSANGEVNPRFNGPPSEAPDGCMPWFDVPHAAWRGGPRVLFGHWAALGLHHTREVVGLDTGCVWGGRLSALRLDDDTIHSVPASPRDAQPR